MWTLRAWRVLPRARRTAWSVLARASLLDTSCVDVQSTSRHHTGEFYRGARYFAQHGNLYAPATGPIEISAGALFRLRNVPRTPDALTV